MSEVRPVYKVLCGIVCLVVCVFDSGTVCLCGLC